MFFRKNHNHRNVFSPRGKRSRLRFFIWCGVLLVLGLVLIGISYAVLYSPFFKVSDISVSGAQSVSLEVLKSFLSAQLVGQSRFKGMLGPDNILFWFLGNKTVQVSALPALSAVNIQPDLFKKQIVLELQERKLFGVLCLPDSECYGFDEKGIAFTKAPQTQGVLILRIEDQNQRPIVLGRPFFSHSDWLDNIFATFRILEDNKLFTTSLEIKPLVLEEWQANLAAGPDFYFSLGFVPADFDATLKNLLKRLDLSKLQYLDFRVENRIYYK